MGILPTIPRQYDTEGHKATVKRLYDELNKGDVNVIYEVFAPDAVIHLDGGMGDFKGPMMLAMEDGQLRGAFHDLTITIDKIVASGEEVAAQIRYSGTHSGAYMGVPGTGKPMTWAAAIIDRFEDGKIVEHWVKMDRFALLQQVGIIPSF
jgi:predicted ester cyclase